MWVVKFNNLKWGLVMTVNNNIFGGVEKAASIYQNPNYFSGAGLGSVSLSSGNSLTSASLFDEKYLEKRNGYDQKRDSYGIAKAGRDAAINKKISNLVSYIENGKEGKAMKEYAKLLEEMSKQERYAQLAIDGDDTQLRAVARELIENNANVDLEELIKDNTDASFARGFKLNFEHNAYTQEEILKELCDLDETNKLTGIKRVTGNLCRIGACAGAGFVFGGPVGAIIGTGIGALGCFF